MGKLVNFINRRITHNRDAAGDFGIRVLIHIPVGFLIGLGLLSEDMFLKYERNEDLHTEDQAWKDIAGGMVGYVPGKITKYIVIGVAIYLLVRWLI